MGFVTQVSLYNSPQYRPLCRVYVHENGLDEIFGGSNEAAIRHALKEFRTASEDRENGEYDLFRQYQVLNMCVWGNLRESAPAVDVFGWADLDTWKKNPDIDLFMLEGGLPITESPSTCGDFLAMTGVEEQHRQATADKESYFATPAIVPAQLRAPGFEPLVLSPIR